MKKHVTLFDICKKAGVSSATVSRVINNSPLVQEATRVKVLDAIRELNYRPSHAARMLARQKTDHIGVVMPAISGGYYAEVLTGLDQIAADHQYHIITSFSHGAKDEIELVGSFIRERRVDGLIIMNIRPELDAYLQKEAEPDMPLVLLNHPIEGTPFCSVQVDNRSGARTAVAHLLERGRRKLALVGGPLDSFDSHQRIEAAQQAAADAGCPVPEPWIFHGNFEEYTGREIGLDLLKDRNNMPDALFVGNDEMAIGVLSVLMENGVRIPEDVAVVGFDDIVTSRHIGLSTVHVPLRDVGRSAMNLMMMVQDADNDNEGPVRKTLPVQLVIRRSSGTGPVGP